MAGGRRHFKLKKAPGLIEPWTLSQAASPENRSLTVDPERRIVTTSKTTRVIFGDRHSSGQMKHESRWNPSCVDGRAFDVVGLQTTWFARTRKPKWSYSSVSFVTQRMSPKFGSWFKRGEPEENNET